MTQSVTYIEIDVDYCELFMGVSPCTATGALCYNTLVTCKDRINFANDPVTLRFGMDVDNGDIECIPSLTNVSFSPALVSLGENLGERASLTALFKDHRWIDVGDKYLKFRAGIPAVYESTWSDTPGKFAKNGNDYYFDTSILPTVVEGDLLTITTSDGRILGAQRTGTAGVTYTNTTKLYYNDLEYNYSFTDGEPLYISFGVYPLLNVDAFALGTFWGKFRARQPYLRGRAIRLIRGVLGQTLAEMITQHFLIEDFDGPTPQGGYGITAKDVLKLADGDRAQAPLLSNGYLSANLTAAATSATLLPTGIGNAEYPASGYVAIGGSEIVAFTRSGDVLTITRAQKNTTAETHQASDRVQLCLIYTAEDPGIIIRDLLVTYANVPSGYIDTTEWAAETNAYLQRLYSATIAEPTDIKLLVSELIEQAALATWWDDVENKLRLQVLRSITPLGAFDESNILDGSTQVKEQPEKRITQVWTYYGRRNPLVSVDEANNYRSTLATVDLQIETDYGASSIKKIFSRWIPDFGQSIAERVNDIQLSKYKIPPRLVSFSAPRFGDIIPALGAGYTVAAWSLQDADGNQSAIPVQIVRLNATDADYQIEAEENTFTVTDATDLTNRIIIIDSNINSINLRTIHDTLYPELTGYESPAVTVSYIINAGVIVGATSTAVPAVDVGDWPAGVELRVEIYGRVQGAGGKGGGGYPNINGYPGGVAFYTRTAITIRGDLTGELFGGGGGGAAGKFAGGGGQWIAGGGGRGTIPGLRGSGYSVAGQDGTAETYGIAYYNSGHGGDAGQDGQDGTGGMTTIGGMAGSAIDGVTYVTFENYGSPGLDIRGPQVN